ncbi:MAG: hypothetical protein WBH44_11055, partial [Proteocatella sp.]
GYDGVSRSILHLNLENTVNDSGTGIFEQIGDKAVVSNIKVVDSVLLGMGNMGTIAAENKGTIQNVAVENPTLIGITGSNATKSIGGITGKNSGNLRDIYVLSTNLESPITVEGVSINIGGITGTNSGTMKRVLYLARAPLQHPITAENLINGKLEDVYFLSGSGYNQPHNDIGIPKTTLEFKGMDIPNWYNWSQKEGYPYLTLMPTAIMYPDVE